MARPREFDIDEALDSAMDVFWAKGYEGTSIHDLTAALGIAKGSLYKAFGDKHSLWLRALERYDRSAFDRVVSGLDAEPDGRLAIAEFLRTPIASLERGDRRGCFFCNAAIDQAPQDSMTERSILVGMTRLERALERALKRITPAPAVPAPLALTLMAGYLGLNVMVKAGAPTALLYPVRETLLASLGRS